ncbi:uncharacterized protein LOC124265334 [Haliotis rubra]|uniref:uncharacterized protein LOC124265334 n=1 Tax=Haliotis rubra TaxID=36100 RepID=UPI001EE54D00|nr:uncharacterized protein LOC124265334 [Haliotis rubra]
MTLNFLKFNSEKTELLIQNYCNALLIGLPKQLIAKLQCVQNCAARLVTKTKKDSHIYPVLEKLHWLKVADRITYKVLLLSFKARSGLASVYLQELFKECKPARYLRSMGQGMLCVPHARTTTYGDRSFARAAPRHWNDLPLKLRLINNLATIKTNLKTHLFSKTYT